MRELKFRGWYERAGVWVYVHVGQTMTEEGRKSYSEMCVDGVEWLQFSDLKDKKGKHFCEGDIAWPEFTKQKGVIVFKKGMFLFKKDKFHSGIPLYKSLSLGKSSNNQYEIIGNTTENPELLP